MGKIVVLAEKPSVGRDIARVLGCRTRGEGYMLGDNYIVTWAVGHLVSLSEPDEIDVKYKKWSFETLPILPDKIPLKVISATQDQYKTVQKLINAPDTDSLICATDAGREGELIFRYIYEKTGCRKPFSRLWISSMTDEAISEGFRKIRPGSEYEGLYASAKCRSEADWLVGMNASRAFSLKYDTLLSIGRVQTPTLAMLVKRRKEIEQFHPEGFCVLTADFGDYQGTWFSEKKDPDTHLADRNEADTVLEECRGKTGEVIEADTQRKHDSPPQLYDLTSLQRDANRLLGFTADKTLKLAQNLYETHKSLTYPRTDSRYLPPDMVPRVVQTMKMLPDQYQPYVSGALRNGKLPVSKRTVDASKVTDHHAILPTARKTDPSRFSDDEYKLYDMVVRRMLAAFYPACDYDSTKIITRVGEHTFRTSGKMIIQNGWHDIAPTEKTFRTKKKTEEDEVFSLPLLQKGDIRSVQDLRICEDVTKPPLPHTDASLLAAMETAGRELDDEELVRQMKGSGIGTPATRAAIIERLLKVGYAQRRGKTINATEKGVLLIELMPKELASPEMTGRWELALHEITDGKQDVPSFMNEIKELSRFLVEYAQKQMKPVAFPKETGGRDGYKFNKGRKKSPPKVLLEGTVCPLCGKGPLQESTSAFSCAESDCCCTIWKDCLVGGGGPVLNQKLILLVLEKKNVTGSTGTITLGDGQIRFYPLNSKVPSVSRSLMYQRKK